MASGGVIHLEGAGTMVSNIPRLFAAPDEISLRAEEAPQAHRLGDRVLDRVREMCCSLHGHEHLLQFEQDRLFLKCFSCGHESPGWELNEIPPTITARKDTLRLSLARPQLTGARRIA
jgi:hypothetical protein